MSTSYETIYDLFLRKISDFDLATLEDDELETYCGSILTSALTRVRTMSHDLSNRDDFEFADDLDDIEKEVIACQMVVEWADGQLNNTQLTHMFVGTKDESMASQANHMNTLMALVHQNRARVSTLMRDYKWTNWVKQGGNV